MNLAQFTNDRPPYSMQRGLSVTVGSSIIVGLALLAGPADAAATAHRESFSPFSIPFEATDTQQSSAIRVGVLHESASTLISDAARAAVGTAGLKRLESFFQLKSGWDGVGSKPINLNSIASFSNFFDETGLRPEGLGVFMSAQGNVVVNWLDKHRQLVELEFSPSGLDYFIEENGEEGTLTKDMRFGQLLSRITERVEV